MAPKLYMAEVSPPVRGVLMTAKAIGVQLENVPINLLERDHLKPEFVKINPQHTVPTLVEDDGFTIWDSHAIAIYLITKYAKDKSLLPTDAKLRAVVDQRCHFDSGVLFPRLAKIARSIVFQGKKTVDEEDKNNVLDAYGFLEKFLDNKQWIAGDALTVADYSIISTLSSLNAIIPVDSSKFPKLSAWMKKMERLPAYEVNKKGLEMFGSFFKNIS